LRRYALSLAWLISLIGTLGSLYFSLILHLEPCHLCWYQRICLFPLIFILGFAAWKHNKPAALYTLPQVLIGLIFAGYHMLIQISPSLDIAQFCGQGPSCTEQHTLGFGWVSIPALSLCAFGTILILILWSQAKMPSEEL